MFLKKSKYIIFFRIFRKMLLFKMMRWNRFIAKIILILQKYLFQGNSSRLGINQSTRGSNSDLSANFLLAEK